MDNFRHNISILLVNCISRVLNGLWSTVVLEMPNDKRISHLSFTAPCLYEIYISFYCVVNLYVYYVVCFLTCWVLMLGWAAVLSRDVVGCEEGGGGREAPSCDIKL
jgi:hypothetical protein